MDWKTMLSSLCPKTQTIAACWSRWIQPAMATTNKVKGWLCLPSCPKHKHVAKPLMVALSTIVIDELGDGPARGS